jgi:hypothetical protein
VNFRAYFRHLFEQPEKQVAAATVMRNFSIWFFGLLRNFVLVGLLQYFYETTGSTLLFYVHQLALLVLFLYCLSYVDQWYLTAHRLNVAANVLIGILLFMLINKATSIMVAEFSQAHSR